jgi:hypothetical protein
MKKKKTGLLIIVLWITLLWSLPVFAEQAYISDVVVTNTRDDLLVYFSVYDCFTEDLKGAIESGIETTFTFFIKLYRKSDAMWDTKIIDMEVQHSIRYDTLKQVYEVRLSEQDNQVKTMKSFEEAQKLMAEVVSLKIMPLKNLEKGARYQLRIMAELDKIKLPLYLHHILFFLSLWDFETDWYTIDFRY